MRKPTIIHTGGTILFFVFLAQVALCQAPFAFNYQGLAMDGEGEVLASQEIALRISLVESFDEGTIVFSEEHVVTTNDQGIFAIRIGDGLPVLGNLRTISWGDNPYFIRTEIDIAGGENYVDLGTSQLYSVPYALYAAEAGNASGGGGGGADDQNLSFSGTTLSIEDGNSVSLASLRDGTEDSDADPSNEIQMLDLSGNQLTISGGNSVTLPTSGGGGGGGTDNQVLSLSGKSLSISGGNTIDLSPVSNDADADPGNELQILSISGNQVSISGGNTISIPTSGGGGGGSDSQTLTFSNNNLSISNGNTVNLSDLVNDADADPSNEFQELSISGSQLTISNGNTVAIPGSADDQTLSFSNNSLSISGGNSVSLGGLVNDADADPQNEIQTLSLSNNTLSISGGNSVSLNTGSSLWEDEGAGIFFDGPFADLRNANGTNAVELKRFSNGSGGVDIYGADNNVRLEMYTTEGDGGLIRSEGPNGNLNAIVTTLASDENKGWIATYDETGDTRAAIFASSTGRGGIFTNGANGNGNVDLTALGSNVNHGYVAVRDAAGDVEAGMYVDASGNGRLFADFVDTFIDNPDKAGEKVRYSLVQGPEPAAFLRGTATMKKGQATVDFPSHFRALIVEGSMTVMLTPLSADSKGIAVIKKSGDGFVVRELMQGTGSYDFDWEVKVRRMGSDSEEAGIPMMEAGIQKAANVDRE